MLKIEKEYKKFYGDIPKDSNGRLDYIISQIKSAKSTKGKILSEIDKINKIKWKEISYIVYLIPKGSPRPRNTKNGNHFYVKGAQDNKKVFRYFFDSQPDLAIIRTACKFYCTSYLPIPKSMKISEQILAELGYIRPIITPDFDNLIKTYSDMIQGTLLYNDSTIVEGVSKKFYSVKPRIEITIKYMESFDSEYNRKRGMK